MRLHNHDHPYTLQTLLGSSKAAEEGNWSIIFLILLEISVTSDHVGVMPTADSALASKAFYSEYKID